MFKLGFEIGTISVSVLEAYYKNDLFRKRNSQLTARPRYLQTSFVWNRSVEVPYQFRAVLRMAMAELNLNQKRQLFEQGWVIIPQVVPAEMVRAARYAINSTVENYLDSIQVRARELKTDERLTGLLTKTNAFSLIESALGNGKVVPSTNGQCALRFPDDVEPGTDLNPRPHIDPKPLIPSLYN